MAEIKKIIPGATDVAGVQYLPGAKGMLVPVANIKAQDLLQHELVYQLTDYALDLSAEIARFNGHSRADLAQFDALLAQEYGVTRDTEFKGNRTYTSADGKRQVKIAMSDRVSYGPGLQAAKALLDELITENASGAGPVLTPLVNLAFRVDKEGKVDPNLLRAIKRLDIPDPRWSEIVRAINEAEQPLDSASYVRFYRCGPTGKMELIPLDIAAAFPTPEAFERRSLRRQVEELQARLDELLREPETGIGDPDLPSTLEEDLYCADELLGMALAHLEAAATRNGANLDKIAGIVCELKTNQAIVQTLFAEAKAASPAAA